MRWSEQIDKANPGGVPRSVHYKDQAFMPLEPSSDAQRVYLESLLDQTGFDARNLFGEAFETIDDLSAWAASWGIEQLLETRAAQEEDAQAVKKMMTALMLDRMHEMPVRYCRSCDEDRPFKVHGRALHCASCGQAA